jgi:rubrerythrin
VKETTEKNLKDAFAGESQAHLKYSVFADLADREGLANVGRLFRAASYSEQIHATNHLRALGGAGKSVDNLGAALGGETFEITTMYPEYMQAAEAEGEKRALNSMHDAMEAEKVHARLYAAAREAAAAGKDTTLPKLWVCSVCGYTMEGDAPERCPICGAVHAKFREF